MNFFYVFALDFEKTTAKFADGVEEMTHDNKVSSKLLTNAEIDLIIDTVNDRLARRGNTRIRLPDILRAPLVPLFTTNDQGDIDLAIVLQIVVHERSFQLFQVNSSPFVIKGKLYDIFFPKPVIALHDTHYETFDDKIKVEFVELDFDALDRCNRIGNNYVCTQSLFLTTPENSCIATAAMQPHRITEVCIFHRSNATFTVNPANDTHWRLYTTRPMDIHQDCPPHDNYQHEGVQGSFLLDASEGCSFTAGAFKIYPTISLGSMSLEAELQDMKEDRVLFKRTADLATRFNISTTALDEALQRADQLLQQEEDRSRTLQDWHENGWLYNLFEHTFKAVVVIVVSFILLGAFFILRDFFKAKANINQVQDNIELRDLTIQNHAQSLRDHAAFIRALPDQLRLR